MIDNDENNGLQLHWHHEFQFPNTACARILCYPCHNSISSGTAYLIGKSNKRYVIGRFLLKVYCSLKGKQHHKFIPT